MSNELKPCPFCGGEAGIVHKSGSTLYVLCPVCYASQGYEETKAKAITAWNRRYVCPDKNGKALRFIEGIIQKYQGENGWSWTAEDIVEIISHCFPEKA